MGFILTIIDPNGDWRRWVESSPEVTAILDSLDWTSTIRVIVEKYKMGED